MGTGAMYQDGTYLEHNPTWHEEDSSWKAGHIVTILRKNNVRPRTIGEVGCGAGEVLNSLATSLENDVRLAGYEISPQAFELCKPKEKENLHFFLKDMFAEETAAFDVVLAIDVFEHVEDYMGFLRTLRGKGRYKVFHIPLELSVQSVLRCAPILSKRESVGHIHYFTKETALATLKDTGYEIVDYCYTSHSLDLPCPTWKSKLMKLPRRLLFAISQDVTVRTLGGFSLLVLAR